MGWFRRKKKKAKRIAYKYGKKAVRGGKWVGRRTPIGRAYTAAEYGYKGGRYVYGRLKRKQSSRISGKTKRYDPSQSRRGSTSSSPMNRNRRGRYYYYRGKRIYRRR